MAGGIESLGAAAIGAVVGLAGIFTGWLTSRGKSEADAENTIGDTYGELVGHLRTMVADAIEKAERAAKGEAECERRLDEHRQEYGRLVTWLREQGLDYPGEHEG